MEPELQNGQKVFVNKLVYRLKEPERFDVIVFRYLYEDDAYYIKRIVGLPGETLVIKDGALHIDGEKLAEPYAAAEIADARRAAVPVRLGEDEYFVLGDNRGYSSDSRDYDVGNVKKVQILGKASAKIWPFRMIGHGKDSGT